MIDDQYHKMFDDNYHGISGPLNLFKEGIGLSEISIQEMITIK